MSGSAENSGGVLKITLLSLALLLLPVILAQANVYPTNIKVNGGFTNVGVTNGSNITVSYVLNEPASAGVTLNVFSGTNIVRAITIAGGAPGTARGTNEVVWDGKDNAANPVGPGSYSIAITAAAKGYSIWTQISDDNTNGNVVFEGRGIAVNQNTNSPYYGRVYISNAADNSQGLPEWLGFHVGIVKCNADGSFGDEDGFSTGGYAWAGDYYSPWHLEVSRNDEVYIDDFTKNGEVIKWDPTLSTNSQTHVLRPDNWPNVNVSLSGPALSGSGTNTALWMADVTFSSIQTGLGILRYQLRPDGTCALNDTGIVAVAVGGSLTGNPVDVALDAAGHIYTIQGNDATGDPNNRVFRFAPFDPATNSAALTNAEWAVGANDDTMLGAHGLAVDPTGTYLAVSFEDALGTSGCTQILFATNGAVVTNLDLGIQISGLSQHQDEDCAWDAVGNVYYIDNAFSVWRAVSPPGPNQATTMALSTVQVTAGGGGPVVTPVITGISVSGGVITLDFAAGTNDTPSEFTIQTAGSVTGPYTPVATAVITSTGPGQFRATFQPGNGVQYFRVSRQGSTNSPNQPSFTNMTASGGTAVLTFTGNTTDAASAFSLYSAAAAVGPYALVSNAPVTPVSPGVFQVAVPISGPSQFYKIRK